MTVTCPDCGHNVPDGKEICMYCGAAQGEEVVNAESKMDMIGGGYALVVLFGQIKASNSVIPRDSGFGLHRVSRYWRISSLSDGVAL